MSNEHSHDEVPQPGLPEIHAGPDSIASQEVERDVPHAPCWRCGKEYSIITSACPYCLARNKHPSALAGSEQSEDVARHDRPLAIAMWAYGIVLLSGLIAGGIAHFAVEGHREIDLKLARSLTWQMLVLEVVDSVVILVALLLAGRVVLRYPTTAQQRIITWLLAAPALAIVLAANFAYHNAIILFTGIPQIEDQLMKFPELLNLVIFSYCIQPAIIEEIFMRQLFLGVLSRHMHLHSAVWVSAVAFGMLHIGSALSIPYLIVLGGVLGYLRVASGGILLPILFHFAHNAAVMALEFVP